MGLPPCVGRYGTLTGSYERRMGPERDGLVEVYHLNELVKGREEGQKGPNLPISPVSSLNDPKCVFTS